MSAIFVNPTVVGRPDWPVNMPVSIANVAVEPTVRQTPLPELALASGDPLVVIELSLKINPYPPVQLLR